MRSGEYRPVTSGHACAGAFHRRGHIINRHLRLQGRSRSHCAASRLLVTRIYPRLLENDGASGFSSEESPGRDAGMAEPEALLS